MSLVLTMNPHGHPEHGHGFADPDADPWMDPQHPGYQSQHQSPVHEYPGMHFSPLQMQPMYANPSIPMARPTHQQLQPLIMPQPQWPSMLTSQSSYNQSILHSATMATPSTLQTPIATPLSAPPTTGRPAAPRKTLTDADRRRMCQYAEEHPTVKQTEIGAMFGVERSTVSKVLRNREKYLSQDDGSNAAAKKAKGKFPDIERALSNWVKNQQKQGLPITDSLIREKVRVFATTMGNPENLPRTTSGSWLEKFKMKNGLLGSRARKGSVAEESETGSNPASGMQTPDKMSASPPAVDRQLAAESGTSRTRAPAKVPESSDFVKGEPSLYHSLSTDSLVSAFAAASTAFIPGTSSPQSPSNYVESTSTFVSPGQSRSPSTSGTLHRPRSQTFPMLGIEAYMSPPASEPFTPKYLTSTALEGSMTDMSTPEARGPGGSSLMHPPNILASQGYDVHMQAPLSVPSMLQSSPVTPNPMSGSAVPATPDHPRVEEAQRAMEVVMKFFEQNPGQSVSPQEYMLMGRLMENLRVQATQSPPPPQPPQLRSGEMPGGMHRIPSGDFKTGRSISE